MRYLQTYGRRAAWVKHPQPLQIHPSVSTEEQTSNVPTVDTTHAEKKEFDSRSVINHQPLSPKNPGKRLMQHVPAHAWEPSLPGILPSEQVRRLTTTATCATHTRPHVVETDTRHQESAQRYPEEMREQIRFLVQYRLCSIPTRASTDTLSRVE